MGNCCGLRAHAQKPGQKPVSMQPTEEHAEPVLWEEKNFRLFDFTHITEGLSDIVELREKLCNYRPTDLRCMRPGENQHSFVQVMGTRKLSEEIIEELALIIQYDESGFHVSMGQTETLRKFLEIKPGIQMVYFPSQGAAAHGGFHEIIEWVYFHKDDEYKAPINDESNMGKKLYNYVMSFFTL